MTSLRSTGVLKQPQLAEFTFTEKLGQGSYASVYKAFKKVGQREVVAVKCILKTSLNSISKENLLTEIEVLKTLKHRHIIQLKDFMWDENYVYLIMEYCGGGDLSSYLKKYRIIHESVAKFFLQQLASALQFMRSKFISHMDLKPSNILLTSKQHPVLKIGDFGFAQYLDGPTESSFLRGSLLYMAPEIVTSRQYNEKADLWSVGIILYEAELRSKLKSDVPIKLPQGLSVSGSCRDLLTRLLERNPEKRMSYEEFLGHPFLDFERAPSAESLDKATDLVRTAVSKDREGAYEEAIGCYCQSVEHFTAAIKYSDSQKDKQHLRTKVDQYLSRAEELKLILKPVSPLILPEENSQESGRTKMVQLWQSNSHLNQALNLIKTAEANEFAEQYDSALENYEAGLGVLLNLLKDEPPSERKDALLSRMSLWMSKAEYLKDYIAIKNLRTKNNQPEPDFGSNSYSCVIQ